MAHTAELIAVGTELLLGSIANTDAQEISRELAALGINVYYHTVVGDNPERLRSAVEIAKGRANLIITTGGLGPTCDDLTKNVLADCFGRKLVFHRVLRRPHRRLFCQGALPEREMTENNLQQAMLPEGCTVLDNDWGTAPGCAWEQDGITVIMLPGPPRECHAMLRYRVVPYLRGEGDQEGEILSRTLCLFGIGESSMEARLREQMLQMENPTLAPYAKEGTCELRITAKAATQAQCEALIAPVERQLRELFGELIYGIDVKDLAQAACALLLAGKVSLATAGELHRGHDCRPDYRFSRSLGHLSGRGGVLHRRGQAYHPGHPGGAAGALWRGFPGGVRLHGPADPGPYRGGFGAQRHRGGRAGPG